MVSIKCQSQYNALLLAGCLLTVTGDGAGEPEAAPLQPQGPRPLPCQPSPGPHSRLRRGSCQRVLPGPADGPRPGGSSRYKDYTFAGSRKWRWGGRRGWKLRERAELLFFSPLSPQSELQAYMVKEKK